MLAIDITSASNDRFKTWKKVSASPRAIRKEGFTLAEGLHLAMAARDARVPVRAVMPRRMISRMPLPMRARSRVCRRRCFSSMISFLRRFLRSNMEPES